jgi:hypothetical protein
MNQPIKKEYNKNNTEQQKINLISADYNKEKESPDFKFEIINIKNEPENNAIDCSLTINSNVINLAKNTNNKPCVVQTTLVEKRFLADKIVETTMCENVDLKIAMSPFKLNVQKSYDESSDGNFNNY